MVSRMPYGSIAAASWTSSRYTARCLSHGSFFSSGTDKHACDAVGSMGQKMKCGQSGESRNMISARASRRGFLEEALSELKTDP